MENNNDLQKKLLEKEKKAHLLVKDIYYSNEDNMFHLKDKNYTFDEKRCNCPDKTFHCIKTGLPCKHNISIKLWLKINIDPRKTIVENSQNIMLEELINYFKQYDDFVVKKIAYEKFDWLIDDALTKGVIKDVGSYFMLIY